MNYLQNYREKNMVNGIKKKRERAMLQKMALDSYKPFSEDKKKIKKGEYERD